MPQVVRCGIIRHMAIATRAIIIENDRILVTFRNKNNSQYFTLVGGRVNDAESNEQALVREIMEETGLQIVSASLVFHEKHHEPYNEQYIYICQVAPHSDIAIQETSEEAWLNKSVMHQNIHEPRWVPLSSFEHLPFRTPQLQQAIVHALKKGFPKQPIEL